MMKKKCKQCGNELEDEYNLFHYCFECGKKFGDGLEDLR